MTLDEQIEILQAAKEGKEIQFLYRAPDEWLTKDLKEVPNFNFQDGTYRIKKKTKKVYLYALQDTEKRGRISTMYYENDTEAQRYNRNHKILKRLDYTEIEIDE